MEDKLLKTIDQPNKSNNNIVTPTSSEADTEGDNREVNNEINNNTTVSSNSNEMTNTKNFSVDNQNNNSNFEQDYNNVITNLNSFKITPDNNFHLSNNKEGNIKSIIGKRRHSFDQELLNKRSNINQYIFNPSTKRKIEDDIINNRSKIQNTVQYYSNKSNKRSADEEDDTTKINKRYRKNEVINNLPVKRPGGNIENPSKKRQNSSDFDGEIENINLDVPLSFKEAVTSKFKTKWLSVINDELKNLYENKIMYFVKSLPDGKKPIKTKWVFNVKRDSNNQISKFKARLVAKGFSQVRGIDYELTFSPTLSIDSLKLIIALAAKYRWKIFQLDIKAAYLNAKLDKNIYVTISQGDKNYGKGFWKLNKALYGLKQSGRQWNETITLFLKNIGFQQLISEPCIFKKTRHGKIICIIGIYVDDMIITGLSQEIFNTIKIIKNNYKISNCEYINYLLGIKVDSNNFNYSISQVSYINNILSKFGVNNTRKAKTPCTGDNINENHNPFDKTTYKSALGSLIYLAKCSRPDISFAVNKAARNAENPTISDWHKVINILKYLNSSEDYKITYTGTGEFVAFTDSDLGGDIKDKKSTSGHIILMGTNPICWSSRKQPTVATSTMEAEYIGTSECTKKVLWIRNILSELFNFNKPITIFTDNQASKTTIENGQLNSKLKHINIKFYFNQDNIKNKRINLKYISTENMLADVLTKNVNGPQMSRFSNIIFDKSKN